MNKRNVEFPLDLRFRIKVLISEMDIVTALPAEGITRCCNTYSIYPEVTSCKLKINEAVIKDYKSQ